MKINKNLRLQMLAQSWFFVLIFLLLIILLGYLASQYHVAKDITQANRNILTPGSVNILKTMKDPVNITVYATNDDANRGDTFRKGMIDFMARYQREKKDIHLKFINPAAEPKLAQEANIKEDGEVVVEYNKRTEHISPPIAEQELTNLLVRLARTNAKPVMFLDGHGERLLNGTKNQDLGEFGKQLEDRGFKFANPDLRLVPQVPSNGSMLVIASPQIEVTPAEVKKIKAYLDAGGNLLWLLDDDNLRGLDEIAQYIGLSVSPGMVVEYGTDPKIALGAVYGDHAITRTLNSSTSFPIAHEVSAKGTEENGWEVSNLVDVAHNGWLESGKLEKTGDPQKVTYDPKTEKRGPINIGVALQRVYGKKGQRVVVMGNANFLTNTYITSGANLDLGINIVNWLTGDDALITIQPMPLKDINVTIPSDDKSRLVAWTVFHGFQFFIPIGVFIAGFWLWWKRRKA